MKNVLVIGDSCEDIFIYCDIHRICPEAPVPVLTPQYQTSNDGMALNVVSNLGSIGVGTINVDYVTNTTNIKKTRYLDTRSGAMITRVDENDECDRISKKQLSSVSWDAYDAVIISDYCKGFLLEDDIKYISSKHSLTFMDTKKKLGDWCKDITFIKINQFEYLKNHDITSEPSFENKLIVTLGSDGAVFNNVNFSVPEVSVKDVSGAGDTFMAGLVANYLNTLNIHSAINFANECATVVVQSRGVSYKSKQL